MADLKLNVMISSTVRDLPDHREKVRTACEAQEMFPYMMETLPASSADAIVVSKGLVNKADIYIGVFAFRYGYVPDGSDISITEMEYEHAVDRGIEIMIFLMDEDHPVRPLDVEVGDGRIKLDSFKQRIAKKHAVRFFKSSEGLRADVINSLSNYKKGKPVAVRHQYVSEIPKLPVPYIAHPDTFPQAQPLVGRQEELNLLTDWVAEEGSAIYQARVLSIVAPGGMGKSALAWKWFNDSSPYDMPGIVGRVWWSFYKQDRFEDFVRCALAYVSTQPIDYIQGLSLDACSSQLLKILDTQPFLIVLDSLERILIAYTNSEAGVLIDSHSKQGANKDTAKKCNLPESAAESFIGQRQLRGIDNTQAGDFLRALAQVKAARILITTRLYPVNLQDDAGSEIVGSKAHFLSGLNDDDAVKLWRAFDVGGSRNVLLSLFRTFENYPMLINGLACQIATYRRPKPDKLDRWRQDYPDFDFSSTGQIILSRGLVG